MLQFEQRQPDSRKDRKGILIILRSIRTTKYNTFLLSHCFLLLSFFTLWHILRLLLVAVALFVYCPLANDVVLLCTSIRCLLFCGMLCVKNYTSDTLLYYIHVVFARVLVVTPEKNTKARSFHKARLAQQCRPLRGLAHLL